MPTTPAGPIDSASAAVTPAEFWSLLPAADRERFGLRLSRLVLRAVRDPGSEEDA